MSHQSSITRQACAWSYPGIFFFFLSSLFDSLNIWWRIHCPIARIHKRAPYNSLLSLHEKRRAIKPRILYYVATESFSGNVWTRPKLRTLYLIHLDSCFQINFKQRNNYVVITEISHGSHSAMVWIVRIHWDTYANSPLLFSRDCVGRRCFFRCSREWINNRSVEREWMAGIARDVVARWLCVHRSAFVRVS